MESLVQGIPNAVVYLDDILITGSTEELYMETLGEVLWRNQKAGVKLRREKCVFMAPSVVYLGYRIDRQSESSNGPQPITVRELKSYLGQLNYYGKFLPNVSTI